ncbi:long-chain-fatty-acid--CoA ligase [Saccharopolyspora erythraea]|uniref:long-chain-fatty-acid--CoA ligase n=1 Tax=Saccharopolyspora erythraea TaxID=1836 RepID=UPI001BAD9991|nr:long-chain-fatty-acid--CoA ligase [Saccharopolyspora erythraea]QUH03087.1 long-chain-fatty-acid--CoA ligase [Saccharopolyspora erythraea]
MTDTAHHATGLLTGRGMTMSDQLSRHARKIPESGALSFESGTRTYRELDDRVSRLTSALRSRGVRPGDRIAVMCLNGLEAVETYLASVRLGAICVPVNFRLVAGEVAYLLGDCEPAAVVADADLAPTVDAALAAAPSAHTCLLIGGHGDRDYERAVRESTPDIPEATVDIQDPAFIMYTSGTTGRPKGAVLTHSNLLMHAFSSITHLGAPADDRVGLSGAPLFHIAGLGAVSTNLLLGGRSVLVRSGRFDPAEMVDLLARERVSNCFFVPAQWQAICALPDLADRDLSALRRISWGAAPASSTLLRTMIDTFPRAEVVTMFGQTECSPVTTVLRGEDSVRKIGSVGTPMLNVEVRVVDDDMNDVARGEVGEIVYRSPMVMREYWGKPAETAEAFRGGWFHSGDLVREDEDGYFYVVDRKKDMIISGGENIYCAEVENALATHPGIAEVALIGVPDPRWGETPLAVIVPRDADSPPTAAEVEAWCRQRLAGYKCPRRISVVAELPRNPSGKVLKTRLRAETGT